ncbi:MAG TPA: HK97 gp10 family phage protein [Anaerolineales bacterium]|nr:HK97 gp10 family phage protein [Anaerolineales bacterium]
MIGYEVEVKGLKEQLEKLSKIDEIASPKLRSAMLNSVQGIENQARDNAPVGITGEVRSGFRHKVGYYSGSGSDVWGLVENPTFYARMLEFGTQPHWPPSGPGTKIDQWASSHGMEAFLVARKIARSGVKARRFLARGFREVRPAIDTLFAGALRQIAEALKV